MTERSNTRVAEVLEHFADLLEITDGNPFRIRAYRSASKTVEDLSTGIASMIEDGADLTTLAGFGPDLAAKVKLLVETGSFPDLDEMHAKVPSTVTDLLNLPGLGPKRVRTLFQTLGIASLDSLEQAAAAGRIHSLPGIGKKTEKRLLYALHAQRTMPAQILRSEVQSQVDIILPRLIGTDEDARLAVAGSFRRGKDAMDSLEILAASRTPAALLSAFVDPIEDGEVAAKDPDRCRVRLGSGLRVDVRFVDGRSFGSALHVFTGSPTHVNAIRRDAHRHGIRITEGGVFRGDQWVGGADEDDVYRVLDLPWIPPELREDRGEVEAARRGELPDLVCAEDVRGDLHSHTTASDGRHSLEDMVEAARARGLSYLAITDHSQSLTVAHGLNEDRLLRQVDEIDALNETLAGFTILRGIEVDILDHGRLDLPDRVLERLDLVVGSVHSGFNLSREAQTERILRAMDNRFFTILAHPTGRRLPTRGPYPVDLERIIDHARQRGCFLECNANPRRLDLDDIHCRKAKEAGVLISIATDSHRAAGFRNLEFGLMQARRGWLAKEDVLNTRRIEDLRPLLRRTMRA